MILCFCISQEVVVSELILNIREVKVSKGQLQTAAQILDSLGKVIGESVETVNIQAPELSIKVESK